MGDGYPDAWQRPGYRRGCDRDGDASQLWHARGGADDSDGMDRTCHRRAQDAEVEGARPSSMTALDRLELSIKTT